MTGLRNLKGKPMQEPKGKRNEQKEEGMRTGDMKYYSNQIYPAGLVLSMDLDSVKKEYIGGDNKELTEHPRVQATTYMMQRKESGYPAVGIVFNEKIITHKLAAHEALHAVYMMLDILCHIPLNDYTDEAYAYLIGWVFECIDDFITNDK